MQLTSSMPVIQVLMEEHCEFRVSMSMQLPVEGSHQLAEEAVVEEGPATTQVALQVLAMSRLFVAMHGASL